MAEARPQYPATSSPDVDEHMSVGRYISTRFSTLVPPMNPAPNPFKALTLLNRTQWLNFSVCRSPRRADAQEEKKTWLTYPTPIGRVSWVVLGRVRLLHRLPCYLRACRII